MSGYTDVEKMNKVVDLWIQKMVASKDTSKRCKGIIITMGFEIYDPDMSFHIRINDGVVGGGIGEDGPAQIPEETIEFLSKFVGVVYQI